MKGWGDELHSLHIHIWIRITCDLRFHFHYESHFSFLTECKALTWKSVVVKLGWEIFSVVFFKFVFFIPLALLGLWVNFGKSFLKNFSCCTCFMCWFGLETFCFPNVVRFGCRSSSNSLLSHLFLLRVRLEWDNIGKENRLVSSLKRVKSEIWRKGNVFLSEWC